MAAMWNPELKMERSPQAGAERAYYASMYEWHRQMCLAGLEKDEPCEGNCDEYGTKDCFYPDKATAKEDS